MSESRQPPMKGMMCPIAGVTAIPRMAGGPIQRVDQQEIVMELQLMACVREQCVLWDAQKEGCTVRLGADALIELRGKVNELAPQLQKLGPLASLFGKKGG